MKLLEFYFNTFLYNFWPPFCRVGFPLMLVTTVIAMIYLLICHVAFKWHPDWLYIIVLYTIYNRKRHVQNLLCSPPQQRFKNPLLSLTDFMCNGDFLHRYIFSWFFFFVIPQYSKCNAYYYMCYMYVIICCGFNESLLFHQFIFSCSITATLQSKLLVLQTVIFFFTSLFIFLFNVLFLLRHVSHLFGI